MSTEDKIRDIIAFLKSEKPLKEEVYNSFYECFDYMKFNNSELTNEFLNEYNNMIKGIRNQLLDLQTHLKNGYIKNEEFKDAFILSHIPFKSLEQLLLYKLILNIRNKDTINTKFSEILKDLNQAVFNNSLDTKEVLKLVGNYADYDLLEDYAKTRQDKNGNYIIDGLIRNKYLLQEYQKGKRIITDFKKLTDEEKEIIGFAGELYFYDSFNKNNNLLVWNSLDIDRYSHIDLLEYDYKNDILKPHEIKTTVDFVNTNEVIISKDEFNYLCSTLKSNNVCYNLHRYRFNKDLNKLEDGSRFEIYNENNVCGYSLDNKKLLSFDLKCKIEENKYEIFYKKLPLNLYMEEFEKTKELTLKKEN